MRYIYIKNIFSVIILFNIAQDTKFVMFDEEVYIAEIITKYRDK